MNKKELIAEMANKSGLTQDKADILFEAFWDTVKENLQNGEKVSLTGIGVFSVEERAARTGRNPQTGKSMEIPAKKVVKFKPGKGLKDSVG